MKHVIEVKNITKTYVTGSIETKVLKGIDLDVKPGEWLAIMGKSGAGKSTLMYQMSLLDVPTSGEILVEGRDILEMNEVEKTDFRLTELGYVFQDYALVPELSAVENVMVPLIMQGLAVTEAKDLAAKSLDRIGLGHRLGNRPSQLSGGEQQRVSVARATAQNPRILFADEPTANLDNVSSEGVIDVMRELHAEGQTIVMVTHKTVVIVLFSARREKL
jgi:putative ABC transport system ATP-binding protein